MTSTAPTTLAQAYNTILNSSVFRLNAPDIDLPRAIIGLCDLIDAEPAESDWYYLGEFDQCSLGDFIVGAYWACTGWHAGQGSATYAALCRLGDIYTPNYARGPEPESGEQVAFNMVSAYFEYNGSD